MLSCEKRLCAFTDLEQKVEQADSARSTAAFDAQSTPVTM
jgi:hypothetical protein